MFPTSPPPDPDHLVPERSLFGQLVPIAYHVVVLRKLVLSKRLHHHFILGTVCLPSFEPEWALGVVRLRKGFRLVANTAASSIWKATWSMNPGKPDRDDNVEPKPGPMNFDSIEVRRSALTIDAKKFGELKAVWRSMLMGVRFPEPSDGWGRCDGVTYRYFEGEMSGQTWSPEPQSGPGRLVELTWAMKEWVEADEADRAARGETVDARLDGFRTKFPDAFAQARAE